ncbi:MAG: caspase family protein [Paracoccaceae bacterium]
MPRSLMILRLICALWLMLQGLAAHSGERVALLIGNSQYDRPELALLNPQNDARALGVSLRRLGFRVTVALNKDLDAMESALADFTATAKDAEFALFFYAGHGVQITGENFLIGTGIDSFNPENLNRSSLNMAAVRRAFEDAGPDIGMLILDACRNNPFAEAGQATPGLVRTKGGSGLLIAYATDPGNVAFDGIGENSVFTAALLNHLETPGLDVRLMLGRVRQQVVLETRGQQIPWVEEAVLGEHFFVPAAPQIAGDDPISEDLALWREISGKTDPTEFQRYISVYPDGLFTAFARDRLSMLVTASTPATIAGVSSQDLLATADLRQVSAALTALGLLSPKRDQTRTLPADIAPALDGYRLQLAEPGALSLKQLFNDASQVSMFMAATTLQRIRTDIVALRSVDRTMSIASTALEQIVQIAADDASALSVLQQAKNDVDAIRLSRAQILRRLDHSRSYYDEVLLRAVEFVPADATLALVGSNERSRDIAQHLDKSFIRDAELFLKHVFEADEARKGSYSWISDLLPQS